MKTWHDLGGGVRWAWFDGPNGQPHGGMFFEHLRPDGRSLCEGHIGFPPWILVSEEPLTIHPSIDCKACGWHHNITNGRVV